MTPIIPMYTACDELELSIGKSVLMSFEFNSSRVKRVWNDKEITLFRNELFKQDFSNFQSVAELETYALAIVNETNAPLSKLSRH